MIKNDKLICVDLEATCWSDNKNPPKGEIMEIIEVGYALLDVKSCNIEEHGSYFVRPTRSIISEFCTQLTGISDDSFRQNENHRFDEACSKIRKNFMAKTRTWCSYGEYDRMMFADQCKAFGVPYPFSYSHLNIKPMFNLINGSSKNKGLAKAVELVGLKWEGRNHSGADDAYNLARLVGRIIMYSRSLSKVGGTHE